MAIVKVMVPFATNRVLKFCNSCIASPTSTKALNSPLAAIYAAIVFLYIPAFSVSEKRLMFLHIRAGSLLGLDFNCLLLHSSGIYV
jgi:hypothetical protein